MIVGEKLYSLVVVGYFMLFDHILSKLNTNTQQGSEACYHLISENGEHSAGFYSEPRRMTRPLLLVWNPPGWHKDRNGLPRVPFKLIVVIAYRGIGFTMGCRGKTNLQWGSDNLGDFMEGDFEDVCMYCGMLTGKSKVRENERSRRTGEEQTWENTGKRW